LNVSSSITEQDLVRWVARKKPEKEEDLGPRGGKEGGKKDDFN
jgi:hypothetical protein